jgi:hypothetical protein
MKKAEILLIALPLILQFDFKFIFIFILRSSSRFRERVRNDIDPGSVTGLMLPLVVANSLKIPAIQQGESLPTLWQASFGLL